MRVPARHKPELGADGLHFLHDGLQLVRGRLDFDTLEILTQQHVAEVDLSMHVPAVDLVRVLLQLFQQLPNQLVVFYANGTKFLVFH